MRPDQTRVAMENGIALGVLEVFVVEEDGKLVPDFITATDADGMPGIDIFE